MEWYMPIMQKTINKKVFKSIWLVLIGGVGFLLGVFVSRLDTGGGGFNVIDPNGESKFVIIGFDKDICGEHQVKIMKENTTTSTLEPIITYLHSAHGGYLREQKDKKVEWINEPRSVVITYRDRIQGEDVYMTFRYDVNSANWSLSKTVPAQIPSNDRRR